MISDFFTVESFENIKNLGNKKIAREEESKSKDGDINE